MGAFTNLFGGGRRRAVSRVSVLEVFAENPKDSFSAKDVMEESGVSKRGVYLILQDFTENGLLTRAKEDDFRGLKYRLNPNDVRAKTLGIMEQLLTIGGIEARIKTTRGLAQGDLLEDSIIVDLGLAESLDRKPRPLFEIIPSTTCDSTANTVCPQPYRELPYLGVSPIAIANMGASSATLPGCRVTEWGDV